MLDIQETDSEKLKRRLALLFEAWVDSDRPAKRTKALLARTCEELAQQFGVTDKKCSQQTVHGWFKTGRMAKAWIPVVETILGGTLGFSAPQGFNHPRGEGVAHALIQRDIETHLPITWESLMSKHEDGTLETSFIGICPDDAMSPLARQGDRLFFRTDAVPKFGDGVIVRDAVGRFHLRMYSEGSRAGHWLAMAKKDGYRTLDSEKDELQVIAVLRLPERGWADL